MRFHNKPVQIRNANYLFQISDDEFLIILSAIVSHHSFSADIVHWTLTSLVELAEYTKLHFAVLTVSNLGEALPTDSIDVVKLLTITQFCFQQEAVVR